MFENRLGLFTARAWERFILPWKAPKSLRRFSNQMMMQTKIIVLLIIHRRHFLLALSVFIYTFQFIYSIYLMYVLCSIMFCT